MIIAEGFGNELILLLVVVLMAGVIVVGWISVMEFRRAKRLNPPKGFEVKIADGLSATAKKENDHG